MPFHVHISDANRAFLNGLPLSPEAKERIDRFVEQFVANVPDDFRLDPDNRPNPSAPYFLAQHILLDLWGDGRVHTVDFHIRDDTAIVGVLQIVYIDCHP